jgi:hypothetical protein
VADFSSRLLGKKGSKTRGCQAWKEGDARPFALLEAKYGRLIVDRKMI